MRGVMSRVEEAEEPPFVVRDPILVAYLQWQMVGEVTGDSHEFGLLSPFASPQGCFVPYFQSFLEHTGRWSKYDDVNRLIKYEELVFNRPSIHRAVSYCYVVAAGGVLGEAMPVAFSKLRLLIFNILLRLFHTAGFLVFLTFIFIIIKLYYRLAVTHIRRQIIVWQLSKLQTLGPTIKTLHYRIATDIVYAYNVLRHEHKAEKVACFRLNGFGNYPPMKRWRFSDARELSPQPK